MSKMFIGLLLLIAVSNSFAQDSTTQEHPNAAEATEVSTSDILSMDISDSSCHGYCFTGVCFWLFCDFYASCSIETSIRVKHNNPDLLVSVYDKAGDNPWDFARDLYGDLEIDLTESLVATFHESEAGGGHRTEGGNASTDQSLRFKEATAVGHPMSNFTEYFDSSGYTCPSEATNFVPYFSSSIDTLTWRLGVAEMLYLTNLLPGRRVVGKGGIAQQWGAVWPRTGYINQKDDVKAAAVIAQRVGNIVTQENQPHIYNAFNGNNYYKTWLAGELKENDASTGVWQMVAPKSDDQCYVFGENDVTKTRWSKDRTTEDNRYAFTLWRPYECCKSEGIFLFAVEAEVCL